jgi:hypothetical protein
MRLFRRRLKESYYTNKWKEIQGMCASRKTWPKAVEEADKLLDRALKQKGFKGKTTGEKLVAAQRELSFNEEVWFSHKYSHKINDEKVDVRTLKKNDVVEALAGFREALRDLGALGRVNGK